MGYGDLGNQRSSHNSDTQSRPDGDGRYAMDQFLIQVSLPAPSSRLWDCDGAYIRPIRAFGWSAQSGFSRSAFIQGNYVGRRRFERASVYAQPCMENGISGKRQAWFLPTSKMAFDELCWIALPAKTNDSSKMAGYRSDGMEMIRWNSIQIRTKMIQAIHSKAIDFMRKNFGKNPFSFYLHCDGAHVLLPLFPGSDFQGKSRRGTSMGMWSRQEIDLGCGWDFWLTFKANGCQKRSNREPRADRSARVPAARISNGSVLRNVHRTYAVFGLLLTTGPWSSRAIRRGWLDCFANGKGSTGKVDSAEPSIAGGLELIAPRFGRNEPRAYEKIFIRLALLLAGAKIPTDRLWNGVDLRGI